MRAAADKMIRIAPSSGERLTLAICAGLLVVLAVFTGTAAAYAGGAAGPHGFPGGTSLVAGAALGACAFVEAYFALIVLEEAFAAFDLAMAIGEKRLVLSLPGRRGTARLAAVRYDGPITAVTAIETRYEAFTFLGLTLIQQAFRLTFSDREPIVAGADRPGKPPLFADACHAVAARRGLTVKNLGLVDGAFGIPVLVGPSVPDWSTPSLDAAAIEARWRGAARAARLAQLAHSL